jgi:predicted nucleic acid-binding protein
VPHLFEVEVLHVLRRLALGDQISESRGLRAMRLLQNMRLTRYSHAPFVERIWELKENVTAYDASYIALSEAIEAPLITTDGKLSKAPGHQAKIELYDGS